VVGTVLFFSQPPGGAPHCSNFRMRKSFPVFSGVYFVYCSFCQRIGFLKHCWRGWSLFLISSAPINFPVFSVTEVLLPFFFGTGLDAPDGAAGVLCRLLGLHQSTIKVIAWPVPFRPGRPSFLREMFGAIMAPAPFPIPVPPLCGSVLLKAVCACLDRCERSIRSSPHCNERTHACFWGRRGRGFPLQRLREHAAVLFATSGRFNHLAVREGARSTEMFFFLPFLSFQRFILGNTP